MRTDAVRREVMAMVRTSSLAALTVVVVGLVGCGGDSTSSDSSGETIDTRAIYRTVAMVVQRGDDPPELCLQVANFEPPWCSWSVEVDNWSWDTVDDFEVEINGPDPTDTTRWGFYEVDGRWDGVSLDVVSAEATDEWPDHALVVPTEGSTDCPEPADGWFAGVDEVDLGQEAFEALDDYILAQPDFVDLWFDASPHPDFGNFAPGRPTMAEHILNVRFVGDTDRHDDALRQIWDGPLCVTAGGVALVELEAVRGRLVADLDGIGPIHVDPVGGHVWASVVVATLDQAELDRRYGEDRVRLVAALEPVEP